MLNLRSSVISGCYEIQPLVLADVRGRFVKVFQQEVFAEHGLEVDFAEEYYSVSKHGVIRGMHYQSPPMDHIKIVYCVQGEVFDVVVDLRRGSPSYGKAATFNLSALKGNYVYIPKGLAHGFCTTSESATLVYKVSTIYSTEHDTGIHWNSLGIAWPISSPILSERDRCLTPFSELKSPFVYG
jgi:dTDP-4-dehydrorhamnose 3,5-epimerase